MKYETVIGLEIHCELKTKTKIFCGCATGFGADQNTHVCPVCLGLPGVLPVVNRQVVNYAIKAGLATNCEINGYSKFDRKNYYYPDLPKNFQTSQFDLPIAEHGWVDIDTEAGKKRIRLTRIHMEEDAGKLVHSGTTIKDSSSSNVDYNRTGVPLLEIVSEPDMSSAEEARAYMEKIKTIMEYIDVSNCRMEEGNLRADINVSLRPVGSDKLGTRTEMKNINSFKALEDAINYEIERQTEVLEDGGHIIQETRTWDPERGITLSMRSKEEAHDYRYMPEPDLPPIVTSAEEIETIRRELPELPDARRSRLMDEAGLSARIRFCGTTHDVPHVLEGADLYVMPSAREGFGMALAEALSMGLPAVGFRSCIAVRALLRDGESGLLAADGAEALAEKMAVLMRDRDLRVRMGRAARASMRVYAPEMIWGRWEDLMQEVAATSP